MFTSSELWSLSPGSASQVLRAASFLRAGVAQPPLPAPFVLWRRRQDGKKEECPPLEPEDLRLRLETLSDREAVGWSLGLADSQWAHVLGGDKNVLFVG